MPVVITSQTWHFCGSMQWSTLLSRFLYHSIVLSPANDFASISLKDHITQSLSSKINWHQYNCSGHKKLMNYAFIQYSLIKYKLFNIFCVQIVCFALKESFITHWIPNVCGDISFPNIASHLENVKCQGWERRIQVSLSAGEIRQFSVVINSLFCWIWLKEGPLPSEYSTLCWITCLVKAQKHACTCTRWNWLQSYHN